jgi:hypothetical protein
VPASPKADEYVLLAFVSGMTILDDLYEVEWPAGA